MVDVKEGLERILNWLRARLFCIWIFLKWLYREIFCCGICLEESNVEANNDGKFWAFF